MVEAPRSNFGIFGKAVQIAHGLSLRPNFTPAYCRYSLSVLKQCLVYFRIEERFPNQAGNRYQYLAIQLYIFSLSKSGKYYFASPSGPTKRRRSAGFFKDRKDKSGRTIPY